MDKQRAYQIHISTAYIVGALESRPCWGSGDIVDASSDIRVTNLECNYNI